MVFWPGFEQGGTLTCIRVAPPWMNRHWASLWWSKIRHWRGSWDNPRCGTQWLQLWQWETTRVLSDIVLGNASSDPREKAHSKRKLTVCLPLWESSKNVAAPEVVRWVRLMTTKISIRCQVLSFEENLKEICILLMVQTYFFHQGSSLIIRGGVKVGLQWFVWQIIE